MNPLHLPPLMAVMAIVSVALSSCNAAPGSPPSSTLPSPPAQESSFPSSPQVATLPANAGAVAITPTASPSPAAPDSTSPLVVTPPTTDCAVKMAIVSDPESPLNVRSSPDSQGNNVVGTLDNDAFVTITTEQGGWFQIDTPLTGWIAKNRTRYSCALVDEAIELSPTQNQVMVKGEIIGSGSHQYRINLTEGQTLSLENDGKVFPRVLAPNAQSLNEEVAGTDMKKWSTSVPNTGEYILQLDSNYRGFFYQFSLTIN